MATNLGIGQAWLDALENYVEGLQADTLERGQVAVSHLHGAVVARAQVTPGWSNLADNIRVWSEDGQLYIGVNDEDFVSQAFALEYGDETRPPSALLRDLTEEVRAAGMKSRQASSNFGYGVGLDE